MLIQDGESFHLLADLGPRTFAEVSGNESLRIGTFVHLISSSEPEMTLHEGLVGG